MLNEDIADLLQDDEPSAWIPKSDEDAEWLIGKIREEDEKLKKWTDHYQAEIEKKQKAHDNKVTFYESMLQKFFLNIPDDFKMIAKTQASYALPSAKLTFKQQTPELQRDDAKLKAWVEENSPAFIKTKEEVDWGALRKTIKVVEGTPIISSTGEIVKGITVVPRADKFTISFNEKGE